MSRLTVRRESWPLRERFTISRGSKTAAEVVVAEIEDDDRHGRGECVPYARYGESLDGVVEALEGLQAAVADGLDRDGLQRALPPGAARNALDCAFWDLEAKRAGERAYALAGMEEPGPAVTAYTLSLGSPEEMASAARTQRHRPLLKLKLGGDGDLERVAAVRDGAPDARLIVDANEAWTPDMARDWPPRLAELGVELIEQPLPASDDSALAGLDPAVPFCADESCHDRTGLDALADRYDYINIKLDKTGGLTEALALASAARAAGFGVFVGCMVGTSLAMAPAMLVATRADYVDLDGPLLLADDRDPPLRYTDGRLHPPTPELWG